MSRQKKPDREAYRTYAASILGGLAFKQGYGLTSQNEIEKRTMIRAALCTAQLALEEEELQYEKWLEILNTGPVEGTKTTTGETTAKQQGTKATSGRTTQKAG